MKQVPVDRRTALKGAASGAGLAGLAALALSPEAASAVAGPKGRQLNDWEQIHELWSRYPFKIDSGDLVAFAAQYRYGTWFGMSGSETLAWLRQHVLLYPAHRTYDHGGRGRPFTAHVGANLAIDLAAGGRHASSKSYRVIVQGVHGVPGVPDFQTQPICVFRYDDTYQKINGKWWFKDTKLTTVVAGDLSHHVGG